MRTVLTTHSTPALRSKLPHRYPVLRRSTFLMQWTKAWCGNNECISPSCSLALHLRTFNIIMVLTFSKIRALRAMPLDWQELKSRMWAVGTAPWTHGVRAPGRLNTQQVSQPYHSFSMLLNLEILSHFSKAPLISPEKPCTKNSSYGKLELRNKLSCEHSHDSHHQRSCCF